MRRRPEAHPVDRGGAGFAWAAVTALLGALALLGWPMAPTTLDWQPSLVGREPWRAFSAVAVHYNRAHLLGNLGGLLLTGLFGWAARVPSRIAVAWLAAWPLTQLGLALEPSLAHYGGLSGVLHAGMAAAATFLILGGSRRQRWVGAAVLLGLAAKVISESPGGPALRGSATLGIDVVPLAHATGAIAGVVCAAVAAYLPPSLRQETP